MHRGEKRGASTEAKAEARRAKLAQLGEKMNKANEENVQSVRGESRAAHTGEHEHKHEHAEWMKMKRGNEVVALEQGELTVRNFPGGYPWALLPMVGEADAFRMMMREPAAATPGYVFRDPQRLGSTLKDNRYRIALRFLSQMIKL